jgi:hypothetical protein
MRARAVLEKHSMRKKALVVPESRATAATTLVTDFMVAKRRFDLRKDGVQHAEIAQCVQQQSAIVRATRLLEPTMRRHCVVAMWIVGKECKVNSRGGFDPSSTQLW